MKPLAFRINPEGITENSPALQGWVPAQEEAVSPEGTAEKWPRVLVPSGLKHAKHRKPPFGAWSLGLLWSLEFGVWSFSRCLFNPHRPGYGKAILACLCALITLHATAQSLTDSQLSDIRFDQKLNSRISLDLQFRDENGKTIPLRNYFDDKPVILSLGYYECPMLCTLTFNGMVEGLNDMKWSIGDQFTVIHVSIDPKETTTLASAKKQTYLKRYGRTGAASGWHFLTGNESAIRQLADEVGFHYAYDPSVRQYAHPSGLVILTPEGVISKYFFGVKFAPNELYASLQSASQRKVGSPIERLILLCFHYSPLHGRYGAVIVTTLRILGLITLVGMAWFFAAMIRTENKKRRISLSHGADINAVLPSQRQS